MSGDVNMPEPNSDEARPAWRAIVNAFCGRVGTVTLGGELIQGFLGGLASSGSTYQLGDPINLSSPVLVQGNQISQSLVTNIGSFLSGFSQELNCDIDLLFLPGSAGTAIGATAVGMLNSPRVNAATVNVDNNWANSMCLMESPPNTSNSSSYGMRIAKWMKS
jgi:hypothetical protein